MRPRNQRTSRSRRALGLVFILGVPASGQQPAPVVPTDGMSITADTTFAPGTYFLPSGVRVEADGVTLDGSGATLVGAMHGGTGVYIAGRKNVTVRNLRLRNYYHGVVARDSKDVTIAECEVRDTHEVPGPHVWLNIWQTAGEAYGSGILLVGLEGSNILVNDLQHQQNGLCMYNCTRVQVAKNDASYNSGWGIHMNACVECVISENVADFCNRVYHYEQGGAYVGADATGLLMVMNSSRNKILRNNFRGGGDGVFVAGYGPDERIGPCNDNLFEGNDCSLSPNNAFEATFCTGNVFRNNKADGSNYGFWLGYSRDSTIVGNSIKGNRIAGVAIEHGLSNRIERNEIIANARGVHLWTDLDEAFVARFKEQAGSESNVVVRNNISRNREGVVIETLADLTEPMCKRDRIEGNTITENRVGVSLTDAVHLAVKGNSFDGNSECGLWLKGRSSGAVLGNQFADDPPVWCDTSELAATGFAENGWAGYEGEGPQSVRSSTGEAVAQDIKPRAAGEKDTAESSE